MAGSTLLLLLLGTGSPAPPVSIPPTALTAVVTPVTPIDPARTAATLSLTIDPARTPVSDA
jgi:hypothetical protein